jgi:LmbE family N-acetylglucosaminyl deacetylase
MMKVLFVHAHFDDFEFTAAGTFELWRRKFGKDFLGRVLVCTDGRAGHHFRSREETGRMRLAEQEASARIGAYEFELLRLPSGETVREGCPQLTLEFVAALWKAIRDFEPDYLLCPPLPIDPLVGIHNDHLNVADAIRRVAYLINVPHAFTPEFPADEAVSRPCKVPVILTVHDSYMFGADAVDLGVDVGEAWAQIVAMSWCHYSQVAEWLPWVGVHGIEAPASVAEWGDALRLRSERQNRSLGIDSKRPVEVFRVTAWGALPELDRLLADLPPLLPEATNLTTLRERLASWRQA